jgi:hypothetical protein
LVMLFVSGLTPNVALRGAPLLARPSERSERALTHC